MAGFIERDIPEDHAEMLRNLCGIQMHEDFDSKIVDEYWSWRKLGDRISVRPQPNDLVAIVRAAGERGVVDETPAEAHAKSVVWLFENKRIEAGHPIEFLFRKERRPGAVQGVSRDGKVIVLDEQGEERMIRHEDVFLIPEMAKV